MSTLSDNISTIMWNVQLGAMSAIAAVNGVAAKLQTEESPAEQLSVPYSSGVGNVSIVENVGIYSVLQDMRGELSDLSNGMPSLSELLIPDENNTDILEAYQVHAEGMREKIELRFAALLAPEVYQASAQYEGQELTSAFVALPNIGMPSFATERFNPLLANRVRAVNDVLQTQMQLDSDIITTKINATIDQMGLKKQMLQVEALLAFAKQTTEASAKLVTRELVKPEDISALYSKLVGAKAELVQGIAANNSTEMNARIQHLNALNGYYALSERISKANISIFDARASAVNESNAIAAKKLVGLASAASAAATAGYSAARVGFELSEKKFV